MTDHTGLNNYKFPVDKNEIAYKIEGGRCRRSRTVSVNGGHSLPFDRRHIQVNVYWCYEVSHTNIAVTQIWETINRMSHMETSIFFISYRPCRAACYKELFLI